jgi:YD repeat-containing protein
MFTHKIFYKIIFSFVLYLALQVQAEEIRDYYSEPGLNPFKEQLNQSVNEHIDPFSGTLQLKHTDIVIPGNGGMDIRINRVYTSLQGLQFPNRTLNGFGWTMHFGRIVAPVAHADKICNQGNYSVSTRDNPSVEWSDGGREMLVLSSVLGDGSLITRSNTKAVCNSSGVGLLVTTPDGTEYTMDYPTLVDGVTSLLTTKIEDVHGNTITIEYQAAAGVSYPVAIYRSEEGAVTPVVTMEYSGTQSGDPYAIRLDRIIANGQVWEYRYEPIDTNYINDVYQLTEVERPDGKKWLYRYNAFVNDPDPEDDYPYGSGSFSLSGLTYPEGAEIAYSYQDVQFDPGLSTRTTAISTKTVSGDDIDSGVWTFEFSPYSKNEWLTSAGWVKLDVTTITTPQSRIVYSHYGLDHQSEPIGLGAIKYFFWDSTKVGLLRNKETYSLAGVLLERQAKNWGERLISSENFFHGNTSLVDVRIQSATYAPILDAEYVNRDNEVQGGSYSHGTTYDIYDDFGNPEKIIELSNFASMPNKITDVIYQNNTAQWVIGLPVQETLSEEINSVITSIGVKDRVYFSTGKLQEENNFGVMKKYTYHATGDVASVEDANGKIKTFDDYKRGVARAENWPEAVNISREVNDSGTIERVTNGRSKTTSFNYDGLNRRIAINFPAGESVTISYPSNQNRRILSRGAYQQVDFFDQLGRLIKIDRKDTSAAVTYTTNIDYDQLGRKVFESFPDSVDGVSYEYDALNRVTKETQVDGNGVVEYVYDGSSMDYVDQNNKTTTYDYYQLGASFDGRNIFQINQPELVLTQIERNALGLVTSVWQGERGGLGYLRRYEYNAQFFLESEHHPEIEQLNTNASIVYSHDAVGNIKSRIVGDSSANNYIYDDLNRLTNIDYPTSDDVSYTYTKTGRVKTIVNNTAQKTFTYDDNDNLSNESVVIAGVIYNTTFSIDALDAVSAVTYPSGRSINYAPNAFGWPTQAMPYATNVTYHSSGRISSMTYANGQVSTINLTGRLWIDSIQSVGSESPVDLKYNYDNAGNATSIVNNLDVSYNRNFSYDDINRLETSNGIWGATNYSYNTRGDILTGDNGNSLYVGFLLDGIDDPSTGGLVDTRIAYDNRGNISADDQTWVEFFGGTPTTLGDRYAYTYSDGDELLRVQHYLSESLAKTVDYEYDGDKNRVKRDDGSKITHYVYAQSGILIGEYDEVEISSGKEYFYLGNQQIASATTNELPVADAGSDQTILYGLLVTLDGSGSIDNDGTITNYQWVQTAGQLVSLSNNAGVMPTFIAPDVATNEVLTFGLVVIDSSGESSIEDTVMVTVTPPIPGTLKWSYDIGVQIMSSPIVGADGTVYAGSRDGYFHAINADGTVKWSTYLTDTDLNKAAGVGSDGTFYIPSGDYLFAINPDGSVKWSYQASDHITSSSSISSDGTIYFASFDNYLYAINPDGSLRWRYQTGGSINSQSAIGADGTIYAIATDNYLYAITPDGNFKWRFLMGDVMVAAVTPAIGADGTVFIGAENFVAGAENTGTLYAIRPSGVLDWTFQTTGGLRSSPVIGEQGSIYVTTSSGHLYSISPNGEYQWRYSSGSPYWDSSPVIGSNGIIYSATGGFIHAVNAEGGLEWKSLFGVTDTALTLSSNGALYFGTESGLVAVSTSSAGLARSIWPKQGRDTLSSGNQCVYGTSMTVDTDGDGLPDCEEYINGFDWLATDNGADDLDADGLSNIEEFELGTAYRIHGAAYKRSDTDGDGLSDYDESTAGSNPFIEGDDEDFDSLPDAFEVANGLDPQDARDAAYDSDGDGFVNWLEYGKGTNLFDPLSFPVFVDGDILWAADIGDSYGASPAISAEGVLYARSINGLLSAVNSYDGSVNWNYQTNGSWVQSTPSVSSDGIIYVGSQDNYLYAINLDGSLKWRFLTEGEIVSAPAIGTDGTVYVGSEDDYLYAINPDGSLKWRFLADDGDFPVIDSSPAIDSNGTIYTATTSGNVYAINANGTENWRYQAFGQIQSSPAIGADGTLYIGAGAGVVKGNDDNAIYAINPDGSLKWRYQADERIYSSPVISADGGVYAGSMGGSLYAINPDGSLKWRYVTGGMVKGAPAIGADGTVYAGSYDSSDDKFYAINPDGSLKWSFPVGVLSSPLIAANGIIYITAMDSKLYAFYDSGSYGSQANTPWPMFMRNPQRTANTANVAPQLSITAPSPGSVIAFGDTTVLTAVANDIEDGTLSNAVTWVSDIDGDLGSGESLNISLTENVHTITATVTDSDGETVTDQIEVVVTSADVDADGMPNAWEMANGLNPYSSADAALDSDNDGVSNLDEFLQGSNPNDAAPVIVINSPSNGATIIVGEELTTAGTASDTEDGDISSTITWTSSLDGPLGSGASITTVLTLGTHTITATVIDSAGASSMVSVDVTVEEGSDINALLPIILQLILD